MKDSWKFYLFSRRGGLIHGNKKNKCPFSKESFSKLSFQKNHKKQLKLYTRSERNTYSKK